MTTTPAGPTDADKAAVAALTQRVIAAWAYHDADGFAEVFTEDATMVLPGLYFNGREEIRTYLKEAFADQYNGTQVTGKPLNLRFLGSEVAVLLTQGGVLGAGESEVADDQAVHACWTAVKKDGQWHLAAYMNSPRTKTLPRPASAGR